MNGRIHVRCIGALASSTTILWCAASPAQAQDSQRKPNMKTYVEYPPRKPQSASYTGPMTLSNYQRFQWVREQLGKEGVDIPMPTGN